jgi:predicted dehydrogenase
MIRVAIVGLGRIGSQYVPNGLPRSHVGCVLATPGLTLAAVVDPSEAARAVFQNQWQSSEKTRVLRGLDELAKGEADLIALCTPPAGRADLALAALDKAPRLLVIEKPLADTAVEARAIAGAADKRNVAVRVNFHRRFDPRHVSLRQSLPGLPRHVVMRYGKGLLNYGSHFIDFLIDWFGPVVAVQTLSPVAGDHDNPIVTFRVRMQEGFDVIIIGMGGLTYDQFEIDMFFEDSRIEIGNGGTEIRHYAVTPDRYYKGYAHLGAASVVGIDGTVGGLAELYQASREYLTEGKALAGCDARQAITGLEVLEAARLSAQRGGEVISLFAKQDGPVRGLKSI